MRLHRCDTGKFTVMLRITKILDKTISGFIRKFKTTLYGSDALYLEQFHSGGDDYNPPKNIKALSSFLGNNPRDGVIFLFRDDTERKSASGEKRIYATDEGGSVVKAEIHLKNNGDIVIIPSGKILTSGTLEHDGDLNVSGTISGGVIVAQNGASGSYANSVVCENGIVTGGS